MEPPRHGLLWLPLRAFLDPYWVPWVPTRWELIGQALRMAELTEGDVFYDLGCGDGRVVVEAAKRGVKLAVGVERSPELAEKAVELARREGVSDRVRIVVGDFFSVPIRDASVVYLYLLTRVNRLLAPKLSSELRLGARIISLDFQIPGWRPVNRLELNVNGMRRRLYLYVRGVSDIW